MRNLKFKKYTTSYLLEDSSDWGIEVLGDWFVFDVSNNPATWVKWLNDRDKLAEDTESNATWLSKEWLPSGGCNVTFGSITDLIQDSSPVHIPVPESIIIIPIENVIELLNTWDQLLKSKPEEIVIVEDNDIYKMSEVQ